jgi:Maltokinase N-terminal cap domain
MAVIHRTILKPTKLELLTTWLPTQPWYRGRGAPSLTKAGGFRLDDPAGEVGIELMIVTDTAGPRVDAYLVPLTYRATPGEGTLIGTMDHGVLGLRYAYDGPTDPVFRSQVDALLRGEVSAQAQSESDTIDRTVRVAVAAGATDVAIVRGLDAASAAEPDLPGTVSAPWRDPNGVPNRSVVLRAP